MADSAHAMTHVLKMIGLDEIVCNFLSEDISPDIVALLSEQDMKSLGLSRKEDMVKLRIECTKYGSNKPPTSRTDCGPPMFVIPKSILQNLIEEGFIISDIAKLLSVSERTVFRRMQQYDLSKQHFSSIDDYELDCEMGKVIKEFPSIGESIIVHILKQKGINVQRQRLRDSMHRLDEMGVNERKKGRLQRRVYNVQGPNHLWHIDTNHKLIRWRLIVAGGIDGFSRLITFLNCTDNNTAETILNCFLTGVDNYGIPERVRSDKGMENVSVADYMISKKGAGIGSMITGKSVHNQRIERLWRDVYVGVLSFYYALFYFMEDEGILDTLSDVHLAALHYTFMPKINEKLQIWKEAWAGHRMRTIKTSPRALWVAGQLQNPVGLVQMSNIELYGVDGLVNVSEDIADGERPIITTRTGDVVSGQCRQQLESDVSSTWVSSNFGIDVYLKSLDIIRTHANID